ncbi:DEAD/DEAH box helicase [Micrococcus lylae]|uniref:DEAD/DEAH box helicase n=1 Tax=Micrococcus lylae TaxID=1273 RepID=UPI0021A5DC79|nr:DEAD/DEAH box helicase [Micrococcus lylae]MCT2007574.1 DEAD/DEAH box helicase [Micrococcus lylae]MCT2070423.1 DEAD/DEAH box helicase [Micrococcus lylae]
MVSDPSRTSTPRIDTDAIRAVVGATFASRGLQYASTSRVGRVTFDPEEGLLTAQVAGSVPRPYRVRVWLQPSVAADLQPEGTDPLDMEWEPVSGECTCPVGADCKHVAAVCYRAVRLRSDDALDRAKSDLASMITTADELAARSGGPAAAARPSLGDDGPAGSGASRTAAADWRRIMEPLAGLQTSSVRAPQAPLAIGVELVAESSHSMYQQWGPAGAGEDRLRAGRGLFVLLRPLRRGAKGTWIKGGLTWKRFQYPRAEFDPAHERALRLIYRQLMAEETYPTDAWIMLHQFDSTRIWQLLAGAEQAGVELVAQGSLSDVVLEEPVHVGLDVREADGGELAVSPRLLTAADHQVEASDVYPVGGIGFYRVREAEEGFVAHLVPAAQSLAEPVQHLLESEKALTVPQSDRADFLERVYPRLKNQIEVASTDGSVDLPEFEPPTLRLQADFQPDHQLDLYWSWLYFDPPRQVEVDARDALRDTAHERQVLARAAEVWPRAGSTGRQSLEGVAAARFSETVLPQLAKVEHVRVDVTGERPDYRELTAVPRIEVGTKATQNDWFDLGVQVSVDGHALPFAELFTALVHGKTALILMDGSYLSLDHPAFEKLRALLSEAATLQEWTPENQQVSKHQVAFWEDFKQLADEVHEDPAWTAAMGRLAAIDRLPDPEVPAGLRAELRPYQREGFRWLAFLHELGLGGILADDMGLGKTVQTLALLCHAKERRDAAPAAPEVHAAADVTDAEAAPATDPAADAMADPARAAGEEPFLVVAPSSVVSVWAAEAAKFAPGLDVRVVDQTTRKRRTPLADEVAGADVVVTSYTLLRIDAKEYHARTWAGLVLDEAQFIKNRTAKVHQVARDLRAPFRLAITGTPMENSLADLWALLDVAVPGLFPSHRLFRQEYINPIETGENPERIERLRRRLRPFMLRRSKELVAKDLPPKQEQVLSVELEPAHRKLYDRVLQRERRKVLGLLDDVDGNRFTIFKSLTLLRMLALAPQIVDDQYTSVPSSKLERFLDDLTEVLGEGHRVIVFSQFTTFLTAVGEELEHMGVDYAYLDGSTRRRAEVIQGFREGEAPVFLISLKAGGFGLTLTEADYVFLMDPWWNPAAEAQAVDRAHRIGQDRTVMVYRMVSEGTIEEKVLDMQRRKAELFGALMDEADDSGAGAFTDSLTADDIRELLGADD